MDRDLNSGMSGSDVCRVQQVLNLHGANPLLREDGIFGPKTKAAVLESQRRHGIKVDGIVGPQTRAALNPFRTLTLQGTLRGADNGTLGGSSGAISSIAPFSAEAWKAVDKPSLIYRPRDLDPSLDTLRVRQDYSLKPSPGLVEQATKPSEGVIFQLQPGLQYTFRPWYSKGGPAPNPVWSLPLSLAVTYRTQKDGPHVEVSGSLAWARNVVVGSGDSKYNFQGSVQVTFADLWKLSDNVHLLSPFLQGSGFWNLSPFSEGFSLGVGNQSSVDIIDDKLSLTLQAAVVATWDLTQGQFTLGPQAVLGASLTF